MKKYLAIFFLLNSQIILAQINLVPNYSFENFSQCPNWDNQVNYSTGWENFGGTPDYFNSCNSSGVSVPENGAGFQYSSSGNAYCGFFAYPYTLGGGNPNIREHIAAQLNQPLVVGTKYCASIKVSSAFKANNVNCGCNNVGIKFSTVSYQNYAGNVNTPSPAVNNFAHIYSPSIISDTLNWTAIEGTFTADSAYTYIIIGNFFDINNTDTLIMDSSNYCKAYYYIDDVVVYECDCDTTPPLAKFNYSIDSFTVNFNDLSSVTTNNWQWNFGDENTDTVQNPVHTYDSAGTYIVTLVSCYDFCCDTFSVQVAVNNVGIDEFQISDYKLRIYPNPASGSVTVTAEGGDKVIVTDLAGRKINELKISEGQIKINTDQLSIGVYFISLYNKNNLLLTDKFFVAK